MHSEFPDRTLGVLMSGNFLREEFSPLITVADFDTVASLCLNVSFMSDESKV